jgi:hypothetical protein
MGDSPASRFTNAFNRSFTTVADPRLCKICRILLLEPHTNSIDLCNLDIERDTSGPTIEIIKQSAISGCPVCHLFWETFQTILGNTLGVAKKDRCFRNVLNTTSSALPRVIVDFSPVDPTARQCPTLTYELRGESSDRVPVMIYHDLQYIVLGLIAPDSESASNLNRRRNHCDDANYV